MNKPLIYLAGPISGLTYDESVAWRKHMFSELEPWCDCMSPMRGKDYLKEYGQLHSGYDEHKLSTSKAIVMRDHNDVMTSDLIFFNFLQKTDLVSIGTILEIGWAYAYRKPIVMALNSENKQYNHAMINEIVPIVTADLDESIAVIKAILVPTLH